MARRAGRTSRRTRRTPPWRTCARRSRSSRLPEALRGISAPAGFPITGNPSHRRARGAPISGYREIHARRARSLRETGAGSSSSERDDPQRTRPERVTVAPRSPIARLTTSSCEGETSSRALGPTSEIGGSATKTVSRLCPGRRRGSSARPASVRGERGAALEAQLEVGRAQDVRRDLRRVASADDRSARGGAEPPRASDQRERHEGRQGGPSRPARRAHDAALAAPEDRAAAVLGEAPRVVWREARGAVARLAAREVVVAIRAAQLDRERGDRGRRLAGELLHLPTRSASAGILHSGSRAKGAFDE